MRDLKRGSHIHLMGICGTAMASLAGLLKSMGYFITGSDKGIYPPMSLELQKMGIEIKEGFVKENLHPRPDFVIVGNVIKRKYEEAQFLLQNKIPHSSFPKVVKDLLIADRDSYVVAGTHGKTTTTALLGWVAEICRQNPGFIIGGIPKNFEKSFRPPPKNVFIIEGDEYDSAFFDKVPKFKYYKPQYVILTSIELDHIDIYSDLQSVYRAFDILMDKISREGVLIYNKNIKKIDDRLKVTKCRDIFSYGKSSGDYFFRTIEESEEYTQFEVFFRGESLGLFQTSLYGEHNILNILSCIALAHQRRWDLVKVKEGVSTFSGVKRRQEVIGSIRGITVIDDFAHHPTAVKKTIRAVQNRFRGHTVHSLFEPRTATSRCSIFQNEYFEAFSEAQRVYFANVYDSKALGNSALDLKQICHLLNEKSIPAQVYLDNKTLISALKGSVRSGDCILIMSNGDFGGLYKELIDSLK